MSAFIDLFGAKLQSSSGEVATEEALAGKDAVAIYFSAHWCPPCRGFTPKFAEIYKELVASGKKFEVVFVSSDKDESSFSEYFGEQPWLALPYAERKTKDALSKKFKVSGIPSLIILDGATGETITKDGRSAVMEDPKGVDFPWKPPTLWEALGDEFLKGSDGDTVEISELRGEGKVLGIYFSAHWCPPCRGFTPKLIETYNKLKAAGKDFEIIFASSDKSASEFQEYFGEMPWLAIPQGDARKAKLSKLFEVEGIPSFVTIDAATGKTINANARGAVGDDPEGTEFPWHPKPVNSLSSPEGINENAALCVLMESCSQEVKASATAALTAVAEARKAAGSEMLFFTATSGEGAVGQVRKLTKLEPPAEPKPQILLLDIPDNGGFYTSDAEVTQEGLAELVAKFEKGGVLERKQLG